MNARGERWPRPIDYAVIPFILGIAALILYPVFQQAKAYSGPGPGWSSMLDVSLGVQMYSGDHDDRLPPAARWMDSVYGYLDVEHVRDRRHPKDEQPHFSFNTRLDAVPVLSLPHPEKVPLVFNSTNLARNACDPFTSLPTKRSPSRSGRSFPPRYATANGILKVRKLPSASTR